MAQRLQVVEIFINQGYCVQKVIKYASISNSTWYSQKQRVKKDKRKNNLGRPVPGYTINPDGSIIPDELIVSALEHYRNQKEFSNGGGYQKLLQQLLFLKQQDRSDISQVLEENYMNPVSLNDLAYLSGRSLSTFKRDFQAIYNIPPSRWLQKRRLRKAKELLSNTEMSVTDVCYTTGFENLSHFSKVYKSHYEHSPSYQRNNLS